MLLSVKVIIWPKLSTELCSYGKGKSRIFRICAMLLSDLKWKQRVSHLGSCKSFENSSQIILMTSRRGKSFIKLNFSHYSRLLRIFIRGKRCGLELVFVRSVREKHFLVRRGKLKIWEKTSFRSANDVIIIQWEIFVKAVVRHVWEFLPLNLHIVLSLREESDRKLRDGIFNNKDLSKRK